MQQQYLFEKVNGFPMPRLPLTAGGAITADGVRFFDLKQAAEHFAGFTEEQLREHWEDVYPWSRQRAATSLPDLTSAPLSVVEGWKIAMQYSRVTKYRHFSDEQFAEFLGRSAALGLNPLSGQVYGALRPDPETRMPIVTLIVGIGGFRSIAQRTGERRGTESVQFEMGSRVTTFKAPDPEDPDGRRMITHTRPVPESATVVVYRRTPDGDVPYSATVYWDDYYPSHQAPTLWDEKPRPCLGRCALAAAYRDAFPESGNCYVREEMMGPTPAGGRPARPPGVPASPPPTSAADPADDVRQPPAAEDEDDVPQSRQQLELKMIDMGITNPVRRAELIARFRKEWSYAGDGGVFFANVYRAIRDNLRQYDIDAA